MSSKTPIVGHRGSVPIIEVERYGDQVRFWCQHCKTWHYHGNGEGDLVAHCHDEQSPFRKTGYVVILEPEPVELVVEVA